jgi:uncharacterized repeat protein (TIGR01451 family)
MRRLLTGCLGVVTVIGATRSGVATVVDHSQSSAKTITATSTRPGEVHVDCGSTRTFTANSEIHFVEVEKPDLVEITSGGKELTVVGLREGSTQITIWYAASEKPVQMTVRVAGSGSLIQTASGVSDVVTTASGETKYVQQLPAISLESSTPVMTTVGKMVEQQIVVKNIGAVPAEQVEVRGSLSIDAELISTEPKADISNSTLIWRFSRIPAGGQQRITLRVKPLVAGELNCHTNVSFKSSGSGTQVREPKLKLACEGPNTVIVGNEVRLAMHVTNVGSAPAEGIRIRQIVPGVMQTSARTNLQPLMLEVGTLEPGESRTLETASVARDPGLVRINLVAESDSGTQSATEHVLRVTAPKLSVTTSGPDFRYLNRKGTYRFTLTNPGDAAATNVNLMVGLPEGLEYVDATGDAVFNADKRTVAWAIGSLDPQQIREFTVNLLPKAEGQHLQRIVAWGDGNLLAKADKMTRVEGLTALVMEIRDADDPIEIGSETVYQIHIMNRGSKAAERVQIAATVPDGMMPLRVESSGRYRIQGQQIQFETIPSLAPQSATVLQVHVQGVMKGTQRFRAVMKSAVSEALITEESTEVYGD